MRLSTSTRICESVLWDKKHLYYDLGDTVRKIALAGYDSVDLFFPSYCEKGDKILASDRWESFAEKALDIAQSNNVVFSQSHGFFYPPFKAYEIADEWHETLICRTIITAGKMGIPVVVLHPFFSADDGIKGKSLKLNIEKFSRYGEIAYSAGTRIAIENIFGNPNRLHRFGASFEDLIELVEHLDDECFGICWDTGHGHLCGFDQRVAIKAIGRHLIATHIADNDGKTDLHTAPFLGRIDWINVVSSLKEIGYSSDFSFEIPNFTVGFDASFKDEALLFSKKIGEYLLALDGFHER
jgi:sugar phosphate isomerase/epimerase